MAQRRQSTCGTGFLAGWPQSGIPSAGGSAGSAAGLVAAYSFEEITGTPAQDASGQANQVTLKKVSRTSSGKFGLALSFNGSNSLVTVNDSASLDLTNAMTLSAWVHPTSWASGWKTVLQQERSGGLAYALNANSHTNQFNTTVPIGSYDRQLNAGSHLPSNTWTHLAATYDGSRQRLYVNGAQCSRSRSGSLETSTNPLHIGGSPVWAGQFFQGRVDEVRIYNRALSQMELAAFAQQPVYGASPSTATATTQPATSPTSHCATPCTLWDNATTLGISPKADYRAVEVGLKFRSAVAGQVTGVRFYKGSDNSGIHVGRLSISSGQLLAQAAFSNESATGWQQVNFSSPVSIQASTTYVISYYAPTGRYASARIQGAPQRAFHRRRRWERGLSLPLGELSIGCMSSANVVTDCHVSGIASVYSLAECHSQAAQEQGPPLECTPNNHCPHYGTSGGHGDPTKGTACLGNRMWDGNAAPPPSPRGTELNTPFSLSQTTPILRNAQMNLCDTVRNDAAARHLRLKCYRPPYKTVLNPRYREADERLP